jgi:fumarate hydratase subunit beta
MDGYLELCYQLGVAGTIGKGGRSPEAARLCREYGRVYFLSYGGMAALISEQVKKCENAAYDDLGAEAVKRLWVEKLRLIVGIDTTGAAFCNEEIRKYRRGGALFGEDMQHILGA